MTDSQPTAEIFVFPDRRIAALCAFIRKIQREEAEAQAEYDAEHAEEA